MSRRLLLPIVCLVLAGLALPASAQVRRCVDARGVTVYTDRACEAVNAVPQQAPGQPAGGAHFDGGFAVRGCARRPEQLLDGVRGALEARDVNRLANWYHWTGTGSGTARHLMDELEAIAERPLVGIELVYPSAPAPSDPFAIRPDQTARPALPTPAAAGPAGDGDGDGDGDGVYVAGPPQEPSAAPTIAAGPASATPVAEPPPRGLVVQQMGGNKNIAASSTEFRLVRNAGCWWIEL